MDMNKLKRLVSQGEHDQLEFKSTTTQYKPALKTICGMLNGVGGFLIFGVSDRGEIKGHEVSTKTMEALWTEIRKIDPPAFPEIEILHLDSKKSVIIVRVPGKMDLFTYAGKPYLRQGPSTVPMPKREYDRRLMEYLHATRRWENEPVQHGITVKDLDKDQIHKTLELAILKGRLSRPAKSDTQSILSGFDLIHEGVLLNAAVVLFGNSQKVAVHYPQCSIRLARFRGNDRLGDFLDNRQYRGHAFDLLNRAEGFLLDHVPISGRVIPGKMIREDHPWYPPKSMREAVANAICHRDYTIPGGSVSLAMYDDHLEIINPGSLHFGLTPQKLKKAHESKPWNPIIANVLYRAGIIEKWGMGTLNILAWCKQNGNPPPSWEDEGDSIIVSFKPIKDLPPLKQPKTEAPSEEALDKRILSFLENGPLSKSEIAERMEQKHVSGALKNAFQKLIKKKLIVPTIPNKARSPHQKYKLSKRTTKRS